MPDHRPLLLRADGTTFSSDVHSAQPLSPWCPAFILKASQIGSLNQSSLSAGLWVGDSLSAWASSELSLWSTACFNLVPLLNPSYSYVLGIEHNLSTCVALDPCNRASLLGYPSNTSITLPLLGGSQVTASMNLTSVVYQTKVFSSSNSHSLYSYPNSNQLSSYTVASDAQYSFSNLLPGGLVINTSSGSIIAAFSYHMNPHIQQTIGVNLGTGQLVWQIPSGAAPYIQLGHLTPFLTDLFYPNGTIDVVMSYVSDSNFQLSISFGSAFTFTDFISAFPAVSLNGWLFAKDPVNSSVMVNCYVDSGTVALYAQLNGVTHTIPSSTGIPSSYTSLSVVCTSSFSSATPALTCGLIIDGTKYCPSSYDNR